MALRLATYYHAEDIPSLPGSDAFCSVEMFQAFQHAKGFRPLLLVAYEDERAVGKLLHSEVPPLATFLHQNIRVRHRRIFSVLL